MEHLSSPEFIISCEHAGNQIPKNYRPLFEGANEILNSHRGWDPGALKLSEILAEKTNSDLLFYPYTRLFIEPNRSLGHPKLFSEFTRQLSKTKKQEIINQYYLPYRNKAADVIKKNTAKGKTTVHIGIHTFAPVLDEKRRDFEIGLLYDPKRSLEKDFCKNWKSVLNQTFPDFKIRMNQPYKGWSDGFTTFLRKEFDQDLYLGIELEVNQNLYYRGADSWKKIGAKIAKSIPV